MLTWGRKQLILERLRTEGQVVAKAISQELGVSEDSIRRDMRELAAEGLLQRVHGGALPSSPAVADLAGRQRLQPEGKDAIGRAAASMIRPGSVAFVDGGTTAVQLARHLPKDLRATVVTHSPTIAVELAEHPTVEVVVIGGRLFKHSMVSVGATAMEAISRIRADTYFMGVTGVHPEAGLTTGDMEEASIKLALSEAAAETIVMASSEKLNTASPYLVAPIRQADVILVDRSVPQEETAAFERLGVAVVRAGEASP